MITSHQYKNYNTTYYLDFLSHIQHFTRGITYIILCELIFDCKKHIINRMLNGVT